MELREWVGRTDLAQAIIPVTVRAGTSVSNTILTLYHLPALIFREGNGTPLQYSCLKNPMDRGAWWAAVHGVTKSRTRLSDFTFTFHFHALEKEMATHSSVPAWRIPGTAEPGGLPSTGSHRVGHDWSDLAAADEGERGEWKSWLKTQHSKN